MPASWATSPATVCVALLSGGSDGPDADTKAAPPANVGNANFLLIPKRRRV